MRVLALGALGLSTLLMAASPGCGSDETTAAGLGPIPIQALRGEFEQANCEYRVRCGWMPDIETCRKYDKADYELLQLIADAVFGKVTYDPAAGRAWVEAWRSQRCAINSLAVVNGLKNAFAPVFSGKLAEGSSCFVDGECAGDLYCEKDDCGGQDGCCAGVCTKPPPKAATGEPCGMGIECNPEDFCAPAPEGMEGLVCVAREDNGKPCTNYYGCKDELLCDEGGEQECYKLAASGTACNPDLTYACADYSEYCSPETKTCVKLPGVGQACAPSGERCSRHAWCDVNGDDTCKPLPIEGESCLQGGGSVPCLGDLFCDGDGICRERTGVEVCVGEGKPPMMGTGGAGGGM